MSSEMINVLNALTDEDAADQASYRLEKPALFIASYMSRAEVFELFRRLAARELTAGDFVTRFAETISVADLENKVLLLPTAFKLLAKYPHLREQHQAKPASTEIL